MKELGFLFGNPYHYLQAYCPMSLLNLGVWQLPMWHQCTWVGLGYHNCGTPCKQGGKRLSPIAEFTRRGGVRFYYSCSICMVYSDNMYRKSLVFRITAYFNNIATRISAYIGSACVFLSVLSETKRPFLSVLSLKF